MKKILYLFLVVSLFVLQVKSQNAQSLILVHNVAGISQMNAIANPSRGNIVYVIANSTMYQYNGFQWLAVGGASSPSGWGLTGNAGTNPTNNLLGTTDNQDLSIGANNQVKIVVKATNNRLLFPKIIFNPNAGVFNSGVIGIDESTTGRLRITAGDSDTYNNSLGASIDLHGNSAPSPYAGRLDLVAGSGASNFNQGINFYTNNILRASMLGNGNFGINTALPTRLFHIHGTGPNFRYVDGSQGSGKVLTSDANGIASWQTPSGGGGTAGWGLTGNAGTNVSSNFVGTTDNSLLGFRTSNIERMRIHNSRYQLLINPGGQYSNVNSQTETAYIAANLQRGARLCISATNEPKASKTHSLFGAVIDLYGVISNPFLNDVNSGDIDLITGGEFGAISFYSGGLSSGRFDQNGVLEVFDNTAIKPNGGSWTGVSDRRLKKNIEAYTKGLDIILEVEPISYNYNKKSGVKDLEAKHVSIIAQEIEKILPSTVTIKEGNGLKDMRTFDPSELTWTMINAIKELNKKIESLEKKIAESEK